MFRESAALATDLHYTFHNETGGVVRTSIPTWVIVAIGLVMNIVAALMTNFVIDDLGEQAGSYAETQRANAQLIQLTWQQVDALERRRETILTIMATRPHEAVLPAPFVQQLLQPFSTMAAMPLHRDNLDTLMAGIDSQQDLLRNKIDTLYLDNLQLRDSEREISASISGYRNLALFLQILGLALIMARDLSRKID